jgi:hypothetical protein
MKKNIVLSDFLLPGMMALTLTFGLILAACGGDDVTSPPADPTVDSVKVNSPSPGSVVPKGGTMAFTATVTGSNNPAQTVTWSVEDLHHADTKFTGNILAIASGETAGNLTVRATSTVDNTKFGTVTVSLPEAIGNYSGRETGTGDGFARSHAYLEEHPELGAQITVTVTMVNGWMTDVVISGPNETPALGGQLVTSLGPKIKQYNSFALDDLNVDGIAGATFTFNGIKEAGEKAIDEIKKSQ